MQSHVTNLFTCTHTFNTKHKSHLEVSGTSFELIVVFMLSKGFFHKNDALRIIQKQNSHPLYGNSLSYAATIATNIEYTGLI